MDVPSRSALLDQMVAGLDPAEMARSLKSQLLGEGMLQPAISAAARKLMESILNQPFEGGESEHHEQDACVEDTEAVQIGS